MDDLEGLDDMSKLMLLFGAGALAVAGLGVYGLRKAGVTGPKAWLGVAAVPIVWYGWKAIVYHPKPTYTVTERAPASQSLQPVAIARPLNDLEMLDMMAGWGV